jgi:hypothetical protein
MDPWVERVLGLWGHHDGAKFPTCHKAQPAIPRVRGSLAVHEASRCRGLGTETARSVDAHLVTPSGKPQRTAGDKGGGTP